MHTFQAIYTAVQLTQSKQMVNVHCKNLVVNCSATILTTFCNERHYLVLNVVTFTTKLVVNVTAQQ